MEGVFGVNIDKDAKRARNDIKRRMLMMKHTCRVLIGVFALMLVLGSVGCGKAQETEKTCHITSTEPALVTSADPVVSTTPGTAVEESPGKVWFVPSEADCPAASREDAPLFMTVEDVSPTQATLVLRAKDGSEFGIGYGAAYGIERFEESGWVGVDLGRVFPEIYHVATACREHSETVKFEVNGAPLEPGYYRLNKIFSTIVNGEAVNITYYAYFEIGE